jgi:nitroreductase
MNRDLSESGFDLEHIDRLLTTTRAVRKRLDFSREVNDDIIFECIDLAEQAPTGGNDASRRWLVIKG